MAQQIITAAGNYAALDAWLEGKKTLLVHDPSLKLLKGISRHLEELEEQGAEIVRFSGFQPNPLYESVVDGVNLCREQGCSAIMAIGGGSAMDVAKCIKLYRYMDPDRSYLEQAIVPNDLPFLAMPTTAGTGSETTRYAVIYENGVKQSVTHESCIPQTVLLDSSVLETLPLYQKKATMLDALCHAIEAFWSVNSTEESQAYSQEAIGLIRANLQGYLDNTEAGNGGMLRAANLAGKAINIAQTTAGHAMCYKITSLFGCAHGHAAALCLRKLFPWMLPRLDRCVDPRGQDHLGKTMQALADAMGCETPAEAAAWFEQLFDALELAVPAASPEQFRVLCVSVNPVRLKNFPIRLEKADIDALYHQILPAQREKENA